VVWLLVILLKSVSTQGTLGRLATCDLTGGAGRSSSTTSPARGNNIPADQFQPVAEKNGAAKKRRVDDAAARGAVKTSGLPVGGTQLVGQLRLEAGILPAEPLTRTRRNSQSDYLLTWGTSGKRLYLLRTVSE